VIHENQGTSSILVKILISSLLEWTCCAQIFLQWLDEGMDSSYPLTDDPPMSVTYNSLRGENVALDLTNCMRAALHATGAGMVPVLKRTMAIQFQPTWKSQSMFCSGVATG
jgi:hypothetical protein